MSKKMFLFAAAFCAALTQSSILFAAGTPELSRVTPVGKNVPVSTDKIVFQFNTDMVSLGKGEQDAKDVPVTFTPAIDCAWRWLNRSALACLVDPKKGLKPATRYDISVSADFKNEAGDKIAAAKQYVLETPRAEIVAGESRLQDMTTPERPRWKLKFKTVPVAESLKGKIFFTANGKKTNAVLSKPACSEWESDCDLKILAVPETDLGTGVSYRIVYDKGIEAQNGSLPSVSKGIAASGKTLPEFGFSGVRCWNNDGNQSFYDEKDLKKNPPLCQFDSPVVLVFTDRVLQAENSKNITGMAVGDRDELSADVYLFPSKAGRRYSLTISKDLQDVWGHKLGKDVAVSFQMTDRVPELKVNGGFSVLESGEKTDLIGYAANLDSADIDFKGFTAKDNLSGVHKISDISAAVRNLVYPFSYGVREMTGGKTGFLSGKFKTVPATSDSKFFVSVSPYQVYAKIGWFNSMVWVVDLETGKPVKWANVELYAQSPESPDKDVKPLTNGRTGWDGTASLAGYGVFDPKMEKLNNWNMAEQSLFVKVSRLGSVAVLPLNGSFSISAGAVSDWSVSNVYYHENVPYLRAYGVTAQGVYRRGDTVDYKIYVRRDGEKGLRAAPREPYSLRIENPEGEKVFEQNGLSLSAFGAVDGGFSLPENATAGWYYFYLTHADTTLQPMRFLVSDFTPSPFKVATVVNGGVFKKGDAIKMMSSARLFSGASYAGAKVRRRVFATTGAFSPAKCRENAVEPCLSRFEKDGKFDFLPPYDDAMFKEDALFDSEITTDSKGEAALDVTLTGTPKPYGVLRFESKITDDSGRASSSVKTAKFYNSDVFVGLKKTGADSVGKPVVVEDVVVDADGNLVKGQKVSVTIRRTANKLVREKTAGDVYLAKYVSADDVVKTCDIVSELHPDSCGFIPDKAGLYTALAEVGGHSSKISFYISGADYTAWQSDDNRLKIVPDKKEYAVGDKIVLTIENPVPDARALVTVERYGILSSDIQKLAGGTARVEIPVTGDFFPGVYVSVSVFSPRVAKPVDGEVDLGKPAQWTGYVKLTVNDPRRMMMVGVQTDKPDYRPAETVKVSVAAKLPAGVNAKRQAAVVVLDEAVLSLLKDGEKSYDPYAGLNKLDDLDVQSYSLIKQLVGRQNVAKKGANQGGDGGSDFAVRDVFKYVAYWNPALDLDADGKGTFEFKAPDNLTGWRVIAMTVTPEEFAGTGQARFAVSLPLEARALTPNGLRADDVFNPAVSVFNSTKNAVEAVVSATVSGAVEKSVSLKKAVALNPFERKTVSFDAVRVALPPDTAKGTVFVVFKAQAGNEKDGVSVDIPVWNLTTLQTDAEFGSATMPKTEKSVAVPQSVARFGGSLKTTLSPSILNGLAQTVVWMRDYPYSCWEQRISRAVVAAVYLQNKDAMGKDDLWPDAERYIADTLNAAASFQAENGGMVYFSTQYESPSPYLSGYTAYALTKLADMGYAAPVGMAEKLGGYLKSLFLQNKPSVSPQTDAAVRVLSAGFLQNRGLISQTDAESLARAELSPFDRAVFVADNPENKTIADALVNTAYQTSGTMTFGETVTDGGLLPSKAKLNCAALSAFSKARSADAEKIARGVLALRRKNGNFENTQANAFCALALSDFAKENESESVSQKLAVSVGGDTLMTATFSNRSDVPVSAVLPLTAKDAGKTLPVDFIREGTGRYYYAAALSYPSDFEKSVFAGLKISRRYEREQGGVYAPLQKGDVLKTGDAVRVVLTITVPADQGFVAVEDPVAGALEPVNDAFATASAVDAANAGKDDSPEFYYRETAHGFVRFYARSLGAGTYTVSYPAQVVATGVFTAFPAKAEAMYAPDVFGLTEADELTAK